MKAFLTIFNHWFSNHKHIKYIKFKEISFKKSNKYIKPIQFDYKKKKRKKKKESKQIHTCEVVGDVGRRKD